MTHPLFEYWYKHYPNKKSRGDAEKAFEKINPDADLVDEMIIALDKQKKEKEWKKRAGKFNPSWKNPGPWLRGKCWEDSVYIPKENTVVGKARSCQCGKDAVVYIGEGGLCSRCYTDRAGGLRA